MDQFKYYAPTRILFGKNTEAEVGELCQAQGAGKVLVHFGGSSAQRSGLLDRICQSLQAAGLPYVTLGGVVPNPRLSKVYEGIELCKREQVDFILAVGGGSVIDSAKAIGYGITNPGDVWDYYSGKAPQACAPVGAVLTIQTRTAVALCLLQICHFKPGTDLHTAGLPDRQRLYRYHRPYSGTLFYQTRSHLAGPD